MQISALFNRDTRISHSHKSHKRFVQQIRLHKGACFVTTVVELVINKEIA